MENFWPALNAENSEGPLRLLKEQGELLEKITGGVLTFDINSTVFEHEYWPSKKAVRSEFYIHAPMVGDYKFLLFVLVHDIIITYPVKIFYYVNENEPILAEDYKDYAIKLKGILQDKQTKAVLDSLIAQSRYNQ